ncbi:probable protein phosphatase 2C 64 [Phragmites australis]|uniref:probable protein phosphatase 2C 64 n=1 Tax=Phragmites australis TaxID=29695 RepID=UPI002D78BFFB|nr:probable protein phosphatase 2C 64 [Phragmites australis]
MGNCVASGGTTLTAAGAGGEDGRRRGRRWKAPREEQLGAVPGRIFSNDGRSRTAAVFTQQGRKGINQDAMLVWDGFGGEEDGVLCGVFDGHGPHGHLVARRVRDTLPLRLMSAVRASKAGLDMPAAAWRKAFARAYKAMDKDLRSHATLDCFCSGSTAVTVLKLGSDLYMANIGDSRAVLGSRDGAGGAMVAVQLTVDLKPDVPSEAERIKKCRGRVFALQDEPEVPRVWLPFDDAPGLAMARAFGDFCLKDYGVISVPEFFHWSLTEKDQFVILASDGVWDVLSNQEAVDIVLSSPSRSKAAKSLVEAANREWKTKYPTSKIDDCAVVCLYLDGKMDHERDSTASMDNISLDEASVADPHEAQDQEPTLTRNFTVRTVAGSAQEKALAGAADTMIAGAAHDQNWSGLDGVTRVNSLVQLPRFSEEKAMG